MANSSIKQNLIPNEPTLKDLLDLFQKQLMLSFSCHHVGTIQTFNPLLQTATATINYRKTYFTQDSTTGNTSPKLVEYPILIDCPVICLGGGHGALTFPIANGDECLILFNDRDLDNWFQGGSGSAVATSRLHSFSDGIILVGLRSLANVLVNYDSSRVVLRNGVGGTTMVGVGPSLIKLANATYTLNGLLQNLLTELQSLTTAIAAITVTGVTSGGGVSGVPANAAAIVAIGAQIGATATQLGLLLE